MQAKSTGFPYYFLACLLIAAFMVITNAMPSLGGVMDMGFSDTKSYLAIAATPSLQGLEELTKSFPYHHLTRWPVHVIAGSLARLTNLDILSIYRGLVLLALGAAIPLVWALRSDWVNKVMFFACVALNPYTFESYIYAPAMLADCLFYLAVISLVVGLHNQDYRYLWPALFLGVMTRQTAMLFIPAVLVYAWLVPPLRKRLVPFVVVGILAIVAKSRMDAGLLGHNDPLSIMSLATGIFADVSRDFIFMFLSSVAALALTLMPLAMVNSSLRSWGLALIGFLLMASQPLLGGPAITGANAARLIAFGLPFLGWITLNSRQPAALAAVFVLLSCLVSQHHHYTHLFADYSKSQYGVLLAVVSVLSLIFSQVKWPEGKRA